MPKILWCFLFVVLIQSVVQAESLAENNRLVRLATTTSTENSGLLEYLLPSFEKETGYKVHVIAVGTGKALRMGKDGDVDVLLVHAPKAEKKFIASGYGVDRTAVMHNDFVIVGAKDDPAKLHEAKTLNQALRQIASEKSRFVSRGDDSGTHKKELSLWQNAEIKPEGKWHVEAGQGMGKVLLMAGEMDAYTLTDRGTWLAYRNKSPLKIVFQGDKQLFNPYSIIAVNPKRYPDTNYQGAKALIKWIISTETQQKIADFRLHQQALFIPDAVNVDAVAKKSKSAATTALTH